jgi:predicted ATP-dependent serine protease
MKKLTAEELAKLVRVHGATAEEEAAAIAVVHSLLSSEERATSKKKSAWQRGRVGLRGQLGTQWQGELRR